ncbi:MAG: hypothetical protein KatS3mg031_2780 [Chitinophagales bacterium]|nr:MAG: hypothetical protein KatS3mg031_2780 [Chitinophagales bacterium]
MELDIYKEVIAAYIKYYAAACYAETMNIRGLFRDVHEKVRDIAFKRGKVPCEKCILSAVKITAEWDPVRIGFHYTLYSFGWERVDNCAKGNCSHNRSPYNYIHDKDVDQIMRCVRSDAYEMVDPIMDEYKKEAYDLLLGYYKGLKKKGPWKKDEILEWAYSIWEYRGLI